MTDVLRLIANSLVRQKREAATASGAAFLAVAAEVLATALLAVAFDLAVTRGAAGGAFGDSPLSGIASHLGLGAGGNLSVQLLTIAVGFIVVQVVILVLTTTAQYSLWRIRCRLSQDLVEHLFAQISRLSLSFFSQSRTGDLMSRLSNDSYALATEVHEIVSAAVRSIPLLIVFGAVALMINPPLSVLVLIVVAVNSFVSYRIGRRLQEEIRTVSRTLSKMTNVVQEALSGIALVKTFGTELYERSRLSQVLNDNLRHSVRLGALKRFEGSIGTFLTQVTLVFVLAAGYMSLQSGGLTITSLLLFLYVLTRLQIATSALVRLPAAVTSAHAYAKRIAEILLEVPAIRDGRHDIDRFHSSLDLMNVSFEYEGMDVLRDVNLSLRPGEVVALVGRSGSGKTTLANLVLRLYDPTRGQITLDGRDIREFRLNSYRRLFGVVTQDVILFNDSVYNNLVYGMSGVSFDESDVIMAARAAQAHDFIMSWPQGFQTMIGDRGMRMSGGERQRLAIARAILRDPAILVLDEATSALDTESEIAVQSAIDELLKGRTALLIAHRLTTLRHASRIVVLDGGRVVEQGSHDELLNRDRGVYATLFRRQTAVLHGRARPG